MSLKFKSTLTLLCLIFFSLNFNAQTPGLIFEGLPNTVLDPNGDGYVSLPPSQTPSQFTNVGFPANINPTDVNDILFSEISYVGIPEIEQEPTGDVSKGPTCAFTDLVEDADSKSTYYNKSDDNLNMRFRFRLGGAASNSKGYSVLIDTDGLFGFDGPNKDPGATPGNPGFEVEIVLRTNFSIDAYDIDDTTTPSLIISRPFATHAIKSIALTTVCDDPDYFYDFYLPFSDLVGYITSTTKIRMVTLTSINPKGIIGNNGSTSDVAGVNDSTDTTDNLYIDVIETLTPSDGPPLLRASCPEITGGNNPGSILDGDTQVTGTSTEEDGTIIQVFINNVAHSSTTTVTTGNWTQTGLSLSDGDSVKATATVPSTVASGVEKGTSIDNCDIEMVLLTACTPPATPTTIEIGNSGKSIDGTITGLNNINVKIKIFSNGTEVTSWGNQTYSNGFDDIVSNTGAWSINGGGGFKAPSGYYSVIIIPQSGASINCPSEVSNSILYCRTSGGGADGIESGTITLDTPSTILTSTSNISGVLGNTNATTVRLFKNNVFTGLTDISSGDTAWSIDISSLTLVSGDILYVSNKEDAATCTSISANKTVQAKSLAPTLDEGSCSVGNTTSVSGISNEANATIRLYTNASPMVAAIPGNLEIPTTTVTNIDGSWTISGLNIPSGTYIVATAQNTGESESEISKEVQTSTKTEPTALAITSDPITEGDVSITGTSSGLPTGSTIQLYLDDSIIDGKTGTTDASGNWTIAGLDNGGSFDELYTNAVVTVSATSTAAGSCESNQSSSKVVVCLPPTKPTITAVTASPICENSIFTVTIVNAQPGLAYQLLDQDNNTVGPTAIGPSTAADITIDSDPLAFSITSLKVRAFKILGTCTSVESNSLQVVMNPSPTITFGTNPFATQNVIAQTVNLTYSATTNGPDQYSIDFDAAANTAGFVDVTLTTLPVSPIVINVPANVAAGVYNASVTVKEPVNGCEKSYPITITILDPNAPMVTFGNTSVSQCSGITTADFSYSLASGDTPTLYTVDFNDVSNLQGFLDVTDVALPVSPITITVPVSPNAGVYNGIIRFKTAGGIVSQEYPITISIEVTNPGIVGQNQIVSSGDDVAAFTSIQDATGVGGITYQWQKSTTSATAGFADIGGATSATFDEGTITQTTYYRRVATSVTNSCSTENTSNVITVTVLNFAGTPMITQVYQFGNERWVEITNIHPTDAVPPSSINVALFRDKNRVLDGTAPDATFTLTTTLAAGASVLLKNTNSVLGSVTGTPINDDNLTEIDGGNDIIILSTTTGATAWENRYDIVSSIENKTSLVRIDETTATNKTYTESEWVTFIDDAIKVYGDQTVAANEGRHPHAPLVLEITGSDSEANTRLGLHRIEKTTRTGSAWNNGFPDRSRFVEIAEDYEHTGSKLSARKLTVNTSTKLGVNNNLLVVTNDIVLEGDIRLIDATGNSNAQLIQTHESASLVTGGGKLLVDQNSTVPSKYRYNYMGSPVKSASGSSTYTIADVFKDGTNPTSFAGTIENTAAGIARDITFLTGTNYDGTFTASSISLADYWIYTFAANGSDRSAWVQKRSTGTIPNTDGFIFKGPGRVQNYTFLGVPKDGTITTSLGADQSYLVANPYASAISVKEFIEDNLSAITGTLYFWKHAGELDSTSDDIEGHLFSGYVGGYATRTISTGVTAKAANLSGKTGMVNISLEAEDEGNTSSGELEGTAVLLNAATDSITFKSIPRSVDSLRISYKSNNSKIIEIKVNDVTKTTVTLPSTSNVLSVETISLCVFAGSNITIASTNTDTVIIDYLILYDMNGEVACSPSSGDAIFQEPEAYIPIGQGFFVSGDTTDGGTITFNNSQREYKVEGTGSSTFFKSSSKSNSLSKLPVIKLGMNFKGIDDGNSYHRQIAASFSSLTSFGYDKGYDAEMYDIGATDIYWKFPNNEDKYVITGVQGIATDLEVPLEIVMGYSGEVTIKIDEMKNVNQSIYITDKVTGVSEEIRNGEAKFNLDKGIYSGRFVLAFKASNVLAVDDKITNAFTNIYIDNKNDLVSITKKQEIDINKVQLFDLLGKQVASWKIKEQKEQYQLEINRKLPTGVYIIKLNSDKGESNKKVIIE